MIKVLVVEDSPTTMAVLKKIIGSDPDLEVVGEAVNGREAVDLAARLMPDVITMDIFMPVMDGCTATREIMASTPVPIVVVTAYDIQDLGPSFDVLAAGALDIIRKPKLLSLSAGDDLQNDLVSKIKSAARIKVFRRSRPELYPEHLPSRLPAGASRRKVLLIGGSAGAPGVLADILGSLPVSFPVPIVVVQHISPPFVNGFVSWLDSQTPLHVELASHGVVPRPGFVYMPLPDLHLGFALDGTLEVSPKPPIKGHRPAIDYLLNSAAEKFKDGVVAVLLSGMGDDGVDGARSIFNRNGLVLTQDPSHALVTGIPQAAIKAGVVNAALPTKKIIYHLTTIFDVKEDRP